jgi:hypothetical protein
MLFLNMVCLTMGLTNSMEFEESKKAFDKELKNIGCRPSSCAIVSTSLCQTDLCNAPGGGSEGGGVSSLFKSELGTRMSCWQNKVDVDKWDKEGVDKKTVGECHGQADHVQK